MHLKSMGALCARTLSYESCEFELVDGISDEKVAALYNKASEIWTALHSQLLDRCTKLKGRDEMREKIKKWSKEMQLTQDMRYHLDLHRDSDSESENDDDDKLVEERKLRRTYREREAKHLLGKDFDWSFVINYHTEAPLFLLTYLHPFLQQDCSGLLTKDSFGVFALPAKSIPPSLWLKKHWMTVTAVSSDCRVQERLDPRELQRRLESMRTPEDPSKTLYQPQMKVCNSQRAFPFVMDLTLSCI